jgi:hypothetical protein
VIATGGCRGGSTGACRASSSSPRPSRRASRTKGRGLRRNGARRVHRGQLVGARAAGRTRGWLTPARKRRNFGCGAAVTSGPVVYPWSTSRQTTENHRLIVEQPKLPICRGSIVNLTLARPALTFPFRTENRGVASSILALATPAIRGFWPAASPEIPRRGQDVRRAGPRALRRTSRQSHASSGRRRRISDTSSCGGKRRAKGVHVGLG